MNHDSLQYRNLFLSGCHAGVVQVVWVRCKIEHVGNQHDDSYVDAESQECGVKTWDPGSVFERAWRATWQGERVSQVWLVGIGV